MWAQATINFDENEVFEGDQFETISKPLWSLGKQRGTQNFWMYQKNLGVVVEATTIA